MAAAMPWPGLWPLAWVGLVPLLVALRNSQPRQGAACGFVFGAAYFGIVMRWLLIFGFLPWLVAAVLATPAYLALFGAAASRLRYARTGLWSYLLIPAAWTAVQWLRSLGPTGLTWGSLAHTQANVHDVVQLASLTGPWGIEFLVCAVNLAIAGAFLDRGRWRPAPAAVFALLTAVSLIWGHGTAARNLPQSGEVDVAVIQGNLPQGGNVDREFIDLAVTRYVQMTEQAARRGAELVVWPETTMPVRVERTWDTLFEGLAKRTRASLIIGGYDDHENPAEQRDYNGAHVYDSRGEKRGVYRKVQLVPYGEYVPLRKQMPWLERYGIRKVDVVPGQSHRVLETGKGRVGVSICFESLFPQIARTETLHGAQMLVVMTNDSWFLRSSAARGHLMMSQLRAVENRRWVIRAAATGVSAVISPYGRSINEIGIYRQGIMVQRATLSDALTPYARIGDVFAYACVVSALGGLLLFRSRTTKSQA